MEARFNLLIRMHPAKINVDGKTYTQDLYLAEVLAEERTDVTSFTFVYDTVDGQDIFTPENLTDYVRSRRTHLR